MSLATSLSACWEGTTRETLATVLSIEGTVEFSSDGGRTFAPLRLGDRPGKRAVIRTTAGSQIALAPLPNSIVQLDADSTLEIGRIALTKDGNETGSDMRARYVELKLITGRVVATHTWGDTIARFMVATAHGELIVTSNALFRVETDAARTRITCASGSVGFRPKDAPNTTRIASGFVAESKGKEVNATPADTAPAAQESVLEAVQLEQKLQELAARKRNVLPR